MDEPIITTPTVDAAVNLLKECVATRSIGVLIGANGCGKSFALRALEMRYSKLGLAGVCLRYRCCQVVGSTRGVRDLLLHLGGRLASLRSGATGGLQLFCKLACSEFSKRGIRTLLLDEADLWDLAALGGLVTLYDFLQESGQSLTLVLSGVSPQANWIDQIGALKSRTLRIEHIHPLSRELLLAVLQEWAPPFRLLGEDIKAGKPSAERILKQMHRGTDGNLRRARQFTDLLLMDGDRFTLNEERVADALSKMMVQEAND